MAECKPIQEQTLLSNCPANTEQLLFFNVASELSGMALRTWADVLACIKSSLKPIAIVVGVDVTAPASGQSVWQDDRLIGLGATNNGNIEITVDSGIMSSFGNNKAFSFNSTTGTIDLDYITGNTWQNGMSIYVNLNQ